MTSVYFPREEYEFSASLNKANKDMSAYHLPLHMRFNVVKTVRIQDFLDYVNVGLGTNLTANSTLYKVIRAALQLEYYIAYINVGVHSWSLQMHDRSTIKDYVPPKMTIPPIDIPGVTNCSISNLTNLPPLQDNNVISTPRPPDASSAV
jgi:hypothetical protein